MKQSATTPAEAAGMQSPAAGQEESYPQTQRAEPEPDVTVDTDVDDSIFSRPAHDEIAILAYSYWLDEGQPEGAAEEHWLRAERELRSRQGTKAGESGSAASSVSRK